MVPVAVSWLAALLGAVLLWLYTRHGRQRAHPLIDLAILRHRTFRLSVIGGLPLRIGIGAVPFLLPLMLQLGFGLSPLASGTLTVATAVGALGTRVVMTQAIRRFGFRNLLIGATALSSLFYLGYSQFTPATPHLLLFVVLMMGGLVTSMCMICLSTLGFSEIPAPRMSHATALSAMAQQVSLSFGVVLGAALLAAASFWHGGNGIDLQPGDFSPAFIVVGLVNVLSLWWFVRLDPHAGAQMR
jgi:MFS family permease